MRTTTVRLYRLGELRPEIRATVIDRYRHMNVEDPVWYEPVTADWESRLAAMGYREPKIWFSGFWSQGDGACFEAGIDLDAWFCGRGIARKYQALLAASQAGEVTLCLRHAGRYYHANTMSLEKDYTGEDPRTEAELRTIEPLVLDEARALAREIYRHLERLYEELTADRAVAETIEANDCEFFADGRTF